MIIIMKQGATHEHVEELSRHIERWNVKANPIYGEDQIVIGLLGDLNKGFKIAMTTLDGGRVGVAAQALGIAEGAFNETIKYMKERIQFGKPLSAFQGLQWMVADMKCEIESSKLLLYRAAMAKDSGKPFSMDAAMAKLRCAETAMDVTTKCVQLHGGYGYSREYPSGRRSKEDHFRGWQAV